MKVLAFAILVAVCVEAMPQQRHKSHSLHSSTERREKLFERRKREVVDENENEMGDTIEEINQKSGVADSLYQGDILLTRLVFDRFLLTSLTKFRAILREQEDQIRSKRQAMSDLSRRWPDKKVPYMLIFHTDEKVKAAFRKAAQLWRDNTCIEFKEYKDFSDPGFTWDFLDVEPGDGCVSLVGKPKPGTAETHARRRLWNGMNLKTFLSVILTFL
ncbi:astacin [Ostertagia ostertagi]